MRHVAITLSTLLHMVYIQIPDGIYPRPVTNFLMISLLGGMGGESPLPAKTLLLRTIKMKFGQILVCGKTNIFSMFLAECWSLETSSRLFYHFIKMTIQQDLAIFYGWHIPFLIALYSTFQQQKKTCHIWLLSNWGRLLNLKRPGI